MYPPELNEFLNQIVLADTFYERCLFFSSNSYSAQNAGLKDYTQPKFEQKVDALSPDAVAALDSNTVGVLCNPFSGDVNRSYKVALRILVARLRAYPNNGVARCDTRE